MKLVNYLLPLLLITNLVIASPSFKVVTVREVSGDQMPETEDELLKLYGDENAYCQPIVFRGAAKNWEASKYTLEYLKEHFPNTMVNVMGGEGESINLSEHIDKIRGTSYLDSGPYLISEIYEGDEFVCDGFSELMSFDEGGIYDGSVRRDHNFASECFIQDVLNLKETAGFPLSSEQGRFLNFRPFPIQYSAFIGPKGTWTTLHRHGSTFLAQIDGVKSVYMIAPDQEDLFKRNPRVEECNYGYIMYFDVRSELSEHCEAVDGVELFQVDIEPGDVLYIPKGWWHDVKSLSPSVSFAYGF